MTDDTDLDDILISLSKKLHDGGINHAEAKQKIEAWSERREAAVAKKTAHDIRKARLDERLTVERELAQVVTDNASNPNLAPMSQMRDINDRAIHRLAYTNELTSDRTGGGEEQSDGR